MISESRLTKNDGYVRPKKTLQDKLTAAEIKEKLEDYVEVDDLENVKLTTHLRYFTKVKRNGKVTKKFRIGGFLKNKVNLPVFVVLTNGNKSWSVQVKDAIFFRKLSMEELKDQFLEEIEDIRDELKKVKKQNKRLKEKVKELKKQIT